MIRIPRKIFRYFISVLFGFLIISIIYNQCCQDAWTKENTKIYFSGLHRVKNLVTKFQPSNTDDEKLLINNADALQEFKESTFTQLNLTKAPNERMVKANTVGLQRVKSAITKSKLIETYGERLRVTLRKPRSSPRIILVWNSLFQPEMMWFFQRPSSNIMFKNYGCSETNFIVTQDRKRQKEADAIMLNAFGNFDILPVPSYRLPHQRYVFVSHEPPFNMGRIRKAKLRNYFNWTMAYRWDADIPFQYGYYCKRKHKVKIDFKAIVKRKTKMAAWIVGNCDTQPSKRNEYVRELIKYISVDVFGGCSPKFNQSNYCSRSSRRQSQICRKKIGNKYKFYLAFENTLHKDYVSEKYLDMLSVNLIPVVRGDGDYAKLGPPKSWIDTRNFTSPKHLADLNYLNTHDDEYIKYLKWKEEFKFDRSETTCSVADDKTGYCLLCKKLNEVEQFAKTYKNALEWFGPARVPDDI